MGKELPLPCQVLQGRVIQRTTPSPVAADIQLHTSVFTILKISFPSLMLYPVGRLKQEI